MTNLFTPVDFLIADCQSKIPFLQKISENPDSALCARNKMHMVGANDYSPLHFCRGRKP
jgi:hypothetical protein